MISRTTGYLIAVWLVGVLSLPMSDPCVCAENEASVTRVPVIDCTDLYHPHQMADRRTR